MGEKIKKNWKNIVIILVCLFGLNKCTISCYRKGEIDRLNANIEVYDSIMHANVETIDSLNEVIDRNNFIIENLNKNAATAAEANRQKFLLDSLDRINRQKEAAQRNNELRKLNERLEEVTNQKKEE